nr:aminotransferase class I/II-fold pyridoxal phosphate-dependent enzyme [uncultured Holophaga sp.]
MAEALHGGRIWELARELGCEPGEILDFSANLNPFGPPPGVLEAIRGGLPQALSAYPDTDAPALRQLLCERTGATDECLVLGHGGAALLMLALRALAPRRVLVPEPCFREQPRAIQAAGAELVPFPMEGLQLDLEALDPVDHKCDAVLLTSPHNPTGQCLERQALMTWAQRFPGRGLILDEAFIDYAPGQSLVPTILARPHTVVLRSLTKFYAMPGLRVGYALADPGTAARMRQRQEGWPVGQLDLLAAEAALKDRAFEQRSLEVFRRDAPRFQKALEDLGLRTWPSAGPFALVRLPEGCTGTGLAAFLRPKGILVRTCATWPGLGDRFVRLALKSPGDQERLLEALKTWNSLAKP